MSNAVSALYSATSSGFVTVTEAGLVGMVTIRGDHTDASFQTGIEKALGLSLPDKRKASVAEEKQLLWMSPDELLLVCHHGETAVHVSAINAGLEGVHHLAVNVSDARAVFRLKGGSGPLRDALAKCTPADLRARSLGIGEVRRTRLAQVPAAFWFEDDQTVCVVCFRSVARYVFDLLTHASASGSELGHFS